MIPPLFLCNHLFIIVSSFPLFFIQYPPFCVYLIFLLDLGLAKVHLRMLLLELLEDIHLLLLV